MIDVEDITSAIWHRFLPNSSITEIENILHQFDVMDAELHLNIEYCPEIDSLRIAHSAYDFNDAGEQIREAVISLHDNEDRTIYGDSLGNDFFDASALSLRALRCVARLAILNNYNQLDLDACDDGLILWPRLGARITHESNISEIECAFLENGIALTPSDHRGLQLKSVLRTAAEKKLAKEILEPMSSIGMTFYRDDLEQLARRKPTFTPV